MRPKCARVKGNSGLGEERGVMSPKGAQVVGNWAREGEDNKTRVEGNLAGVDEGVHI